MSEDSITEYCSWCLSITSHERVEEYVTRRNVYRCSACNGRTVQCRYCQHMAKGSDEWDNECCAEHDGTIRSFRNLGKKLNEISEFNSLFERDSVDMARTGKYIAFGIGGAVIAIPAAIAAGPSIAVAAGSWGLLGTAGTGTAISSLSGAALTSASLAAVGGGTMAGGTFVVTAVGAALGAKVGGVIAGSYFGEIEGFEIRKIKSGGRHAVIVVNGFLSEKDHDTTDWEKSLSLHFSKDTWYHLDWEASRLRDLGGLVQSSLTKLRGSATLKAMAKRGTRAAGRKLGPATAMALAADIADNPWHVTMYRAQQTGILLADAIARTSGWTFTLVGHSLGARVIYFALEALSSRREKPIREVYLLGGAVDRNDKKGWRNALKPVRRRIYNCHSETDDVLGVLYRAANGYRSDPIGFGGISLRHGKIHNQDCTELAPGHMEWKLRFPKILDQLK